GLGEVRGSCSIRRIQPHVLSPIPPWLSWHAEKVLRLRGRISGVERDVIGGRFDSWGRGFVTDGVPELVDEILAPRGDESVGRLWSRVEDELAASDREFCGDAGGYLGSLRLQSARRAGDDRYNEALK